MIQRIVQGALALVIVGGGFAGLCWATDRTPYIDSGPDICAGGIDGGCTRPVVCRYFGIEGWKRFVVSDEEECSLIRMLPKGLPSDEMPVTVRSATARPAPDLPPPRPARKSGRSGKRQRPMDRIACRAAPLAPVYGPPDDRPWVLKPLPLPPCAPPPVD